MLRLSLKVFTLAVLVGSLLLVVNQPGSSQTTPPRVVAANRPDAPLQILPTFVDASNPLRPRYGYSLNNTTDKTIIAYAIQKTISLEPGAPITITTLTHLPAKKLLLRPHDSRQEEDGIGSSFEKPPIEITLSVDFVEYADSTRWGEDKIKSGERLDGERAGARAALKKYREIVAAHGVKALIEALADPSLIQPEDQTNSSNWWDGFKTGASVIKTRLAGAKAKGGDEGIRKELGKPYDSTEGRLEP